MPPKLSARFLFWAGLLTAVVLSAVAPLTPAVIYSIWGQSSYALGVWFDLGIPLYKVLLPLCCALIAASLVVKNLEPSREIEGESKGAPPRLSAAQMFWSGAVLTVIGAMLTAWLGQWLTGLYGLQSLVGDVLSLVGGPLELITLPLGIFTVAGSFIIRVLETSSIRSVVRARIRANARAARNRNGVGNR